MVERAEAVWFRLAAELDRESAERASDSDHNIIPGFMDNGEPGGPQIDPNPGAYPGLSRPRPYEASPANGLITQAAPPRPTPAWVEAARASFNWQ